VSTGGAGGIWDPISASIRDLEAAIRNARSRDINAEGLREVGRQVVRDYFRVVRPQLSTARVSVADDIDGLFQMLLQLANKRSARSAYIVLFRKLNALRAQAEIEYEKQASAIVGPATFALDATELAIVGRLSGMLPAASVGYQQAISDLQAGDRLSWRGTAAELREVARETLDHLAPDADVMAAPGFKLEADQLRPTQTQKMRYIVRKRRLPEGAQKVPEDVVKLIETTASFARSTYSRGATATHASPGRGEVRQLKRYVDALLCELLEIDV